MIVPIVIIIVGIVKVIFAINEKIKDEQIVNQIRRENRYNSVTSSQSINRNISQIEVNQEVSRDNQKTTVGPVIYYGNSKHNASDVEFRFKYMLVNGGWRAYIIRQPSFKGRNESLSVTHRYRDSNNNMYYVCWDTVITDIKDIQNVSKFWADCILEYIATGKRFGPQ